VVGLSDIAPGALINPGAAIVTLDDISAMRVDFEVPDRYLASLREGQTIYARSDAYPGETIQGRIAKLDTRIDERTRAITARAEFPNPGRRLKPGMMLRVAIARGQRQGLSIPEAALSVQGDSAFVYVLSGQGDQVTAEQRPVRTGIRQDGAVEILEGLRSGRTHRRRRPEQGAARPAGASHRRAAGQGRTGSTRSAGRRPASRRMMLSDLSVRRPVFAAVAAIILCVIGLASFKSLTVRELPSVDPPVVSVITTYRGASAEVIEERITEVIERQVGRHPGHRPRHSSSRDGQSRINISFALDRDLDEAANDVRDARQPRLRNLPLQADPPQIAKANADSSADRVPVLTPPP
jgi:hypothetical protein